MKFISLLLATLVILAGCSISPDQDGTLTEPTDSAGEKSLPPSGESISTPCDGRDEAGVKPGLSALSTYRWPEDPLRIPFGDLLALRPEDFESVTPGEPFEIPLAEIEAAFAPDETGITPGTPLLKLLSFNEGSGYRGGETHPIRWHAFGLNAAGAEVFVEFYDGNGWRSLWRGDPADEAYEWIIPGINSKNCKIRIVADDGISHLTAQSDIPFTINTASPPPQLVIEIPAFAEFEPEPSPTGTVPAPAEKLAKQSGPVAASRVPPRVDPEPGREVSTKYPDRGRKVAEGVTIEVSVEVPGDRDAAADSSTESVRSAVPVAVPEEKDDAAPEEMTGAGGGGEYLTRGIAAFEKGKYEVARMWLVDYLQKNPQDIEALFALGRAYYYLARYQEAEETLAELVELKYNHAGAYYYLGKVTTKTEALSGSEIKARSMAAKHRFGKAIEFDDKYAAAYNDLGKVYFDEQDYSRALELFEKAAECEPDNRLYLYNSGRTAFAKEDYNTAIDYCLRATKIAPDFRYPYWFAAKSYSELEKWNEAALYWDKVVDMFSFDKRLQAEALRMLYEAQGHLE
ncbi:MAG: tetratricopeptide repeat protein [Planctomycetota bacterium]